MTIPERRSERGLDRRRVPRGGRREGDLPGRFPHLLVADSYDGVRVPCVRYLNKFGFRVEQAASAAEVLAQIAAARPHAILVESNLPNAPASQIVRELRGAPGTRTIPVIVMTSDIDGSERGVADAPLVGVLVKPFALAAMLQEIRRLLREQPADVALESMSETASA